MMRTVFDGDDGVRNVSRVGVALVLVLLATACGDDSAMVSEAAGAGRGPTSTDWAGSGAGAAAPRRWMGIQSCRGSVDFMAIDTTSEEAFVTSFTKNKTRVQLAGVDVGPSPEYSCRGLEFEGVLTRTDGMRVDFESSKQASCTSAAGRQLLVGRLAGHSFDGRPYIGQSLDFSVRIEEAEGPDAGFSPTHFDCTFDLEM
jgi:hypothetical protein